MVFDGRQGIIAVADTKEEEDMPRERKRLYRSESDRMIAGVLGGLAEYLRVEPSLTRIGYVVLTVLTGFFPGIFLYLVMMLIVPSEPESES
jgi:phage shock protein C